jgi:hypothetical protein
MLVRLGHAFESKNPSWVAQVTLVASYLSCLEYGEIGGDVACFMGIVGCQWHLLLCCSSAPFCHKMYMQACCFPVHRKGNCEGQLSLAVM